MISCTTTYYYYITSTICQSSVHCKYLKHANVLFPQFVRNYKQIYDSYAISYNVHNIVHVANDVKRHGTLDKFFHMRVDWVI